MDSIEKKSAGSILRRIAKRYFIDAMGAMAQGLFASLLIGTIFSALGMIPGLDFLATIGSFAQQMAGPGDGSRHRLFSWRASARDFSSAAVGYAANTLGAAEVRSRSFSLLLSRLRSECSSPKKQKWILL